MNSLDESEWRQPCIYVQWDYQTGRQLVFILSFRNSWASSFVDHIPDHNKRRVNLFAWHQAFAKEILKDYNFAYCKLRDIVRNEEKARLLSRGSSVPFIANSTPQRTPQEVQDKANFRSLHDISQHLFHWQETVEVSEDTLDGLLMAQERWRRESPYEVSHALSSWLDSYSGLLLAKNQVLALKSKIKTLAERHMNEMHLV